MKSILFQIKSDFSLESAMKEATSIGLQDIFVIEDVATEDKWIGGLILDTPKEELLVSLLLRGPNEVSWKSQWETFSENFQNGMAHIDLSQFGFNKTLYLTPGEGFGDLSHASTYLMLDLMKDKVIDQNVIDIGAGSGILTLSSILMGAKNALGIEIDPASLRHAEKNELKNRLNVTFSMHLDKQKVNPKSVFLMNMTLNEQSKFMEENLNLNDLSKYWITSGILREQKNKYLEMTIKWGWKLQKSIKKGKWLGFTFKISNTVNQY